jgi:hypothetical protein
MKNILKTTIFAFLLISLGSCTNDKDPVTSANGFAFRDVSEVPSPAVLLNANATQVYKKLEWDRADYGTSTSASYIIQITDHDNDPNFSKPVEELATKYDANPDARKATLTVKDFNDMISKLPTFNCGVMNIDIRIKSILGSSTNQQFQYTEPKTIAVTGYSTDRNILSFANTSTSLVANLVSSSYQNVNDYQGYMYLVPGDYKFYKPDSCGDFTGAIVYGAGAGGTLVEGGESTINIATAGHYFITADLTPGGLKYNAKPFRAFSVYGAAIKGAVLGSANAIAMEDVDNSNVWKVTIDLYKGLKLGFKSKTWTGDPIPTATPTVPYTTIAESNPTISFLGGGTITSSLVDFLTSPLAANITVPGATTDVPNKQTYDIIIDVSKPRNYTYTLIIK